MYPVSADFATMLFYGLVIGLPLALLLKGIAYWIHRWDEEREANRRIKKAMGED